MLYAHKKTICGSISVSRQQFSYLYVVSNSEAIKNRNEFNTNIKDKPKVRVSEYAHIFGTFDFNAVTIAPPGTKIMAHKKQNQRATRSKHGVSGWYIIP